MRTRVHAHTHKRTRAHTTIHTAHTRIHTHTHTHARARTHAHTSLAAMPQQAPACTGPDENPTPHHLIRCCRHARVGFIYASRVGCKGWIHSPSHARVGFIYGLDSFTHPINNTCSVMCYTLFRIAPEAHVCRLELLPRRMCAAGAIHTRII
jgi:hypothetical protein